MKKFKFFAISALLSFTASASVFLFDPETRAKYLEDHTKGRISGTALYYWPAYPVWKTQYPELSKKFYDLDIDIRRDWTDRIASEKLRMVQDGIVQPEEKVGASFFVNLIKKITAEMAESEEFGEKIRERQRLYAEIYDLLPENFKGHFKFACQYW